MDDGKKKKNSGAITTASEGDKKRKRDNCIVLYSIHLLTILFI